MTQRATRRRVKRGMVQAVPRSVPAYAGLDQAARDAIAAALLVLIRRGRQALASSAPAASATTSGADAPGAMRAQEGLEA